MNSVIVAISLLRAMNRLFITLCFMVAPHWRTLIYQNIKSNISDQASVKVLPRQFNGRGYNNWGDGPENAGAERGNSGKDYKTQQHRVSSAKISHLDVRNMKFCQRACKVSH